MPLSGKRVLIGGGAGFIGINLALALSQTGCEVFIVDNFSAPALTKGQMEALLPHVSIHASCLSRYTHSGPLDVIFNLASFVGPVGVIDGAGRIGKETIETTLNSIAIARKHQARLIYVSTSEVYGAPGVHSEGDDCVVYPQSSCRQEYALAKRLAETTIQNIHWAHGRDFDFQIVRPFNVTGPYQNPLKGFVVPRFVLQALNKLPLTIYGSGCQIRAFTHVSDICSALCALSTTDVINEVWNIGNASNRMTVSDLADLVLAQIGGEKITVNPQHLHGAGFHEANDKIPDAEKAMKAIAWRPKVDAKSSVASVVAYWSAQERFSSHERWLQAEHSKIKQIA